MLVVRRRATKDNEGVRDDVMKNGAKQYSKLAAKVSKSSPQVLDLLNLVDHSFRPKIAVI